MPKSTSACNSILALIFNATTWANIAEDDTTGPATDLYLSLHTADPGVGGAQTTNETAYTNYARIAVSRDVGGWDAPAAAATANAALAQFPQCGASGATLTTANVGASVWGALAASNNDAGTMGEKLNDAGSASNPWTEVIESGYTAAQILRLIAAAVQGNASGLEDGTPTFKGLDGTTDRVTATYSSGTRTVTSRDAT